MPTNIGPLLRPPATFITFHIVEVPTPPEPMLCELCLTPLGKTSFRVNPKSKNDPLFCDKSHATAWYSPYT